MITLLTCLLLSRHHFVIDLIKVEFVFGERKVVHMCMCVRVFVRVRVCVREREREITWQGTKMLSVKQTYFSDRKRLSR